MYRSPSQKSYRPLINTASSLKIALAIALSATTGVSADYQQTLAARGADAYAQPPITIDIDNQALAETFSNNIVEANPALSDQEVMIDLQARMRAEQRLEHAAANLDPDPVSAAVEQIADGSDHSASEEPDADDVVAQSNELEGAPAAVASR